MDSPYGNQSGSAPTSPSMAARPQLYQIDFTAVASGKRIASTKRRVRWRFGFANPEALANGQTGTACRGEEHDVTIVWSITSGKRLVLADGQEVHYSNNRNNIFDHSWTMKGNHVLKIVAHSAPPISAAPGFRQYDFFVDGQSFFTFPKVYRLGLAPGSPAPAHSQPQMAHGGRSYGGPGASMRSTGSAAGLASIEAPHNPDEEEAYLQEAIKNSLQENGPAATGSVASAPVAHATPVGDNLLLDFAAAPALPAPPATSAASMVSYSSMPTNDPFGAPAPQQAYAALPPSTTAQAPPQQGDPWGGATAVSAPTQYGAPPAQLGYGAPPAPAPAALAPQAQAPNAYAAPSDPFGAPAQPPQQQPPQQVFAQQPPQQQPPQEQPNPFGSPAPTSVPAVQQDYTPASSLGFASPLAQAPPQAPAPVVQEPVAPVEPAPAAEPEVVVEPASADPALLSMNVLSGQAPQLVSQTPEANGSGSMADQAYAKLVNMDAFDLVKDKAEENRSNPFEIASNAVNNTSSLADMKKTNAQSPPKKEVMKSNPGAMVVSNNQQQGNYGGYGAQMGMGQPQMGMGQPQMGQPQMGMGQPQMGMGQPQMGMGQPQMGMGQPQMGMGQPQMGMGQPQMGMGQPQMGGQQQMGQPMGGQPQMGQPMGQQPQMGQPMGQQQFGQPPAQQPQYGQQPPMQQYGQQQFGGL